jgi:glycerophosphoryl diester phosphodiesterase
MTKWTTRNGLYADKYKEKENLVMRINEITNSTEKLELLRMIDAAIWQAFDAESAYGDYENTETEQGVAATTTTNQAIAPKSAAMQKPTTSVKKLTQQQQAHVKTLGPKELLSYIKTNLKAPTANAPKPATPIRQNSNPTPTTNNSQVQNTSFDTVNAKNNTDRNNVDGESDRQA